MLFHGGAVDHYVVQIDCHEFIEILMEDLVHQGAECGRGICQPKRQRPHI